MNYMLIGTIAVLGICFLIGYMNGFVNQVASLAAVAVGVIGMIIFTRVAGDVMAEEFGGAVLAIVFLLLFTLIVQLIKIVFKAIDLFAKLPIINGFNKMLGSLLGIVEGLVVVWIIYILIGKYDIADRSLEMLAQIQENEFTSILYNYNPLAKLFALYF